ncbi:MAG TPA: TMEM175 family protein [Chloroflexota bacterium]|nr:TMEM175 family protein [Chloroflexota bacterium]
MRRRHRRQSGSPDEATVSRATTVEARPARKEPSPAADGKARLLALSDGVFAVALTILVLDLHVPDLPSQASAAAVGAALLGLWPRYLSYIFSFLVVGIYWMGHRRVFPSIAKVDRGIAWLNLIFLMCISVVPFLTSVLGRYIDYQVAVDAYAGGLAIVGLVWWLVWLYATRTPGRTVPNLHPRAVTFNSLVAVLPPLVFLVSIGLSFFSVVVAQLSWFLVLLVRPAMTRFYGDWS